MSDYSPREERINVITHGIGFILSCIGLLLLFLRANMFGQYVHILSFSLFGISLMVLYAASTLYHRAEEPELRKRLKIFDHSAIYFLIAGTYTPFALITMKDSGGMSFFLFAWGMAIIGIVFKLFFTGRFKLLSTLTYLFMGWIVVFALKPLSENLSEDGMFWLLSGGLSYTVGAVLYSIKKIPYNHAIFHVFVLIGSFCHYISVFLYVLPSTEI